MEETTNQLETEQNQDGESWFDSLPEDAKKEIKKLRKENADTRKKVGIEEKDAKIEELSRALKDIEKKELSEKQQFKQLYEKTKSELEIELLTKKELLDKAKKYEEIYENERQELLNLLPADMQEAFSTADKKQLQILLQNLNKSENSVGSKNTGKKVYDLDNMTIDEELRLMQDEPELFSKLKEQQFDKKRKGL